MIQFLLSGIATGSMYALLAMSLTIVFRVSKVLNFAHGDLMTVSAFAFYTFVALWHWPVAVALVPAVLAAVLVAAATDRLAVRPVWKRGGFGPHNHNWILSTFGVSLLIQATCQLVWGNFELNAPSVVPDGLIKIGDAGITTQELAIIGFALVAVVAVDTLNERTTWGKATEAVAENPVVAGLMSINSPRVIGITWLLSGAIVGLAGILVAPTLILGSTMGFFIAIKAFVVVVIGGLGSVRGTIVAGYAVGLIEYALSQQLSGGYVDVVVLGGLIAVLAMKPAGLFGRGEVVRA